LQIGQLLINEDYLKQKSISKGPFNCITIGLSDKAEQLLANETSKLMLHETKDMKKMGVAIKLNYGPQLAFLLAHNSLKKKFI
jgi:hypothetical protein